ncbi:snake venom 5'-nucleotidase-like [Amphiura filiformis]|uniref:snake venom 5'-nucleotidase-like n=1 Tax=Amphiura filiformis TaxID=82378 RepID=UPI003B228D74
MATFGTSKLLFLLLAEIFLVSADYDLKILHTGDVRCYFEEVNLKYEPCTIEDIERNECFGGWARLDTVVNHYRDIKDNVLLLDVGNQFHGTLWFNVYQHQATSYFMNRTAYDGMALGSHEFDLKPSGLAPFLDDADFPVLSCNIDDNNEPIMQNKYDKYQEITLNTHRIGIVGFSYWNTEETSNTGELIFHDEVEYVKTAVEILTGSGVNKIIVMGRSTFHIHKRIAEEVPGVDIVIGGDINEFLYNEDHGSAPSVEDPTQDYPVVVQPTHDDSTNVLIVQAYWAGKYLGHLDVTFDDDGNVKNWDGNPILLDTKVEKDQETLKEINEWAKKVHEYRSTYVGETNVLLAGTGPDGQHRQSPCRYAECGIGNMIADSFIQQNLNQPTEDHWNDAAIAFINAGGMRNTLDIGVIEHGDVLKLFPYANTIDSLHLEGQYLMEVLEHSTAGYNVSDPSFMAKFLQFSGIQVVYDLSRPDLQRVQSVSVLCTDCQIPQYEPLELDKMYRILMPSFLANGGDSYDMIKEHKINHVAGAIDVDALEAYIEQISPLYHHGQMGRIRFATDKPLPCAYGHADILNTSYISLLLGIMLSYFVKYLH